MMTSRASLLGKKSWSTTGGGSRREGSPLSIEPNRICRKIWDRPERDVAFRR